ncbi:MAG: alpha/beta fold hydrolase [Congregibacter sp.]
MLTNVSMHRRLLLRLTSLLLLSGFSIQVHAVELAAREALSADGLQIAYAEGGTGDLTIVFVHGWTCDRSYWSGQLSVFADRYRVIAVDLAGHGESALGRAHYSMASFGADVAAAAAGEDRVVLVGHSMGGPVILQATKLLGDRVLGVIAVDTLHQIAPPVTSAEQLQAMLAPLEQNYAAATEPLLASMFTESADPQLKRQIIDDMLASDRIVGLGALRGMLQMDIAAELSDLDVPLVLINANNRPTNFDAILSLHPKSELKLMDGVGHFLMMENPDRFNDLLLGAIQTFIN